MLGVQPDAPAGRLCIDTIVSSPEMVHVARADIPDVASTVSIKMVDTTWSAELAPKPSNIHRHLDVFCLLPLYD